MCDQAIEGHVLRKFSWGNMNSLQTTPKLHNINTHQILKSFYEKHYVPSSMKLVVMAPQSLDVLETYVRDSFGNWVTTNSDSNSSNGYSNGVSSNESSGSDSANASGKRKRNNSISLPTEPSQLSTQISTQASQLEFKLLSLEECIDKYKNLSPFALNKTTYITRVIPVKKTHKLILTWSLPPSVACYKSKPGNYISHLMGHEGPGSLLSSLKVNNNTFVYN